MATKEEVLAKVKTLMGKGVGEVRAALDEIGGVRLADTPGADAGSEMYSLQGSYLMRINDQESPEYIKVTFEQEDTAKMTDGYIQFAAAHSPESDAQGQTETKTGPGDAV